MFNSLHNIIFLMITLETFIQSEKTSPNRNGELYYSELDEHTLVTDSQVFPFVAAILRKFTFMSTGALISDDWVLTEADSFYFIRDAKRTLRVRLGSINCKKGGSVFPIKYIEIHPFFDDKSPVYDLALIKLPKPVRFTPNLSPIKLRMDPKEVDATHFVVTSWASPWQQVSQDLDTLKSMEIIKRQRILTVTHLHPNDIEECNEELANIGINNTGTTMCLDSSAMNDPCMREIGAPVVLNGFLWGIVSSWQPPNCQTGAVGSTFVSLVSTQNVSQWIHSQLNGESW